MDFRISFLV